MTQEMLEELKKEALKEFEALSTVYRPSFKTRKIADYLKKRVTDLRPDIKVFEDEYRANLVDDSNSQKESSGNIWFDIPANAPAYEKNEPIILQAHMDMVCAFTSEEAHQQMKESGVIFEYHTNDTITSMNRETTLGADDGIGMGFILALVKYDKFKHGPIRCIITADEEVGMCGASYLGLTKNGEKGSPVAGMKYLINIDNKSDGDITGSTAGAVVTQFGIPRDIETKPLEDGLNIFTISVNGLLGGHDGHEIRRHASAVRIVGEMLADLCAAEDFRLIEFLSPDCEFQNALQRHSFAIFATKSKQVDVQKILEVHQNLFKENYPDETKAKFSLQPTKFDSANIEIRPYSHENSKKIVDLVNELPFGITSWKDKDADWIESSANIGPIYLKMEKSKVEGKEIWINPSFEMKAHFRSCNNQHLLLNAQNNKKIALDVLGNDDFDYFQLKNIIYGWGGDKDTTLLSMVKKSFEERGVKWIVTYPHCGLELSWFKHFNENLSMVSIGPEIHDIHECNETLYIETAQNCLGVITDCIEQMRLHQRQ